MDQQAIIDLSIKSVNLTLLLIILIVALRFFSKVYEQYKRGALYDLEQKEKQNKESLDALSDRELIEHARKGLGIIKHKPD